MNMKGYIVNVSGGLSSFEALRRTILKHGKDKVLAVFADTRIEDPDLYRFLDDQEQYFGIKITRLSDGRNPFDIWRSQRCITMFNGRKWVAPCSQILKKKAIDKWVNSYGLWEFTRVFGYNWDELHRAEKLAQSIAPTQCWFPLIEEPYLDKCDIANLAKGVGIEPPELYKQGFTHNNCGGGCVLAGMAQWALLWQKYPERYIRWEDAERQFQQETGLPYTILNKQVNNKKQRLSLSEFRGQLEKNEPYAQLEWGGCGCFEGGIGDLGG